MTSALEAVLRRLHHFGEGEPLGDLFPASKSLAKPRKRFGRDEQLGGHQNMMTAIMEFAKYFYDVPFGDI